MHRFAGFGRPVSKFAGSAYSRQVERSHTTAILGLAALCAAACASARSGSDLPEERARPLRATPPQGQSTQRETPAEQGERAGAGREVGAPDSGASKAVVYDGRPDRSISGERGGDAESSTLSRCAGKGTSLLARTAAHLLYLCKDDSVVRTYPISIGAGGTPKRVAGDLKTPVGSYPLGEPQRSNRYHLSIPIAYPTPEQVRRGYTGGAIGLHGPDAKRSAGSTARSRTAERTNERKSGIFSGDRDRTEGCLAVDSNREIEEIVRWVRKEKPGVIHIEGRGRKERSLESVPRLTGGTDFGTDRSPDTP